MMYIRFLEKQEWAKPQISRQIMKIRAEISEMETKGKIQRISEMTSWFFEKINDWQTLDQTNQRKKVTKLIKLEMKMGCYNNR
jgi:CHASE3 domain sensor protein